MEGLGHAAARELQILGAETSVLGDASQHARADFLALIGRQRRSSASLRARVFGATRIGAWLPADGKQRTKDLLRLADGH